MNRVLIFANPYSGRRDNRKLVGTFEQALSSRGLEPQVVWGSDQRLDALRAAPDDTRAVVAAGGDGSVADVVNAMHAAGRLGLPFATLPVGNENLFAAEFGFDGRPDAIAEAVARGQTRAIDLGVLASADAEADPEHDQAPSERLFTLMASVGFDAEVVHRVDGWRKNTADGSLRRVKRQSYVPRILAAMFGYRHPTVTLTADGQTVTGGQAYVFNLPQYGGNLGIGRHAAPDDGLLDWVVFQKPGFLRLLGYHWLVLRRKHLAAKTVAHGRSKAVTLTPTNGMSPPVQTDGDPTGHAPLCVGIQPGALHVVVM